MNRPQKYIVPCLWLTMLLLPSLQAQDTYRKITHHVGANASLEQLTTRLQAWYPLLTQTHSSLVLHTQRQSPGAMHYQFQQYYEGLAVYGATLKLNLDHKGKLSSVLAHLADFQPQTPAAFAYDSNLIAARLGETALATRCYIEPQYLIVNALPVPIYRVSTQSLGEVLSYEILIDARNGQELQRQDISTYFRRPLSGTDTTGIGRVFMPDPCTRGEVAYGVWFTDNDDAHEPVFENLMDTVVLKNITWDNGTFRLEGPYVKIEDRASFNIPPATSADGTFFFNRDSSSFEDVMVYFHIDSFHRYVESLGFSNLRHNGQPISADPHGKGDSDQSAFIENNGNPYVVFGDGGVDDAEDADVIVHEFGHVLSFAAAPFTNSGKERRGLDEGIGDYFAAAYSFQSSTFDKDNIFNWDGHNEFWGGRIVNSTLTYPPSNTSIYTYGEIWASTMMDLSAELHDSIVMRLQLQEMYANTANMSLRDAAHLFLDADSLLYNGVHTNVITQHFCDRGLFTGEECSVVIGLEAPLALPQRWTLFPNPASGQWTVQWTPVQAGQQAEIRLIDLQGREFLRSPLEAGNNEFQTALAAGVYLLQLWVDGNWQGTQKLISQP